MIDFPQTLDMRPFMELQDPNSKTSQPASPVDTTQARECGLNVASDEFLYDLTAVLIHRSASASFGHYIAHVFDEE